jgi:glycosyltransferase involved in cell wall biosynthesis
MEVDYGLKSWVPLPEFAKLMSDFDIMVAPLQKTWWYKGKSILRVGIGMALGIPVVASAVGEQKYVIKHGINGYLAKHEEDWYNYLKILIEDESLRESMGREGRRTAENLFSLDACGRKLFNIINTLFK